MLGDSLDAQRLPTSLRPPRRLGWDGPVATDPEDVGAVGGVELLVRVRKTAVRE